MDVGDTEASSRGSDGVANILTTGETIYEPGRISPHEGGGDEGEEGERTSIATTLTDDQYRLALAAKCLELSARVDVLEPNDSLRHIHATLLSPETQHRVSQPLHCVHKHVMRARQTRSGAGAVG